MHALQRKAKKTRHTEPRGRSMCGTDTARRACGGRAPQGTPARPQQEALDPTAVRAPLPTPALPRPRERPRHAPVPCAVGTGPCPAPGSWAGLGWVAPGFRPHGMSWVSVICVLLLPLGPHLFNSVTLFKNLSKYFRPEVVKTKAQRLNSGRSISDLPAVSALSRVPKLRALCCCPGGAQWPSWLGSGECAEVRTPPPPACHWLTLPPGHCWHLCLRLSHTALLPEKEAFTPSNSRKCEGKR